MSKNTDVIRSVANATVTRDTPVVEQSEQDAIFGRSHEKRAIRTTVTADLADCPMGTAYLPEKVLIPGGPGVSNRFSGPVVLDPVTGVPLGLYYFPLNQAQHASLDKYWIAASGGTIIQLKRK